MASPRLASIALGLLACGSAAGAGACGEAPSIPSAECVADPPEAETASPRGSSNSNVGVIHASVLVVDEAGVPIAKASLRHRDATIAADPSGRIAVDLDAGPDVVFVSAPGAITEPVTIGNRDDGGEVRVRLFGDGGGRRFVMHSAGDVMFGRRYEAPTRGRPLVPIDDPGSGARRVVDRIRPVFAAADFRTLNLETAVSDADPTAAYPGKRFILRTRPGALAGVAALEADAVILANNHVRDYRDEGVASTLGALATAKIPFVGAVVDGATPAGSLVREVHGNRVGLLAWTTIDGSFVNDSYPRDGDHDGGDVAHEDRWQLETRSWGFDGEHWDVPARERRIGSAWKVFADAETKATIGLDGARGFTSLTHVYPELQDWVARRGHGGAARWDDATSPAAIRTLAGETDLVVVQLHAGYQFQEAASANVEAIAHAAIDAGADIVICHHPHVLQGLEWYRGKLIAYSLGNFVFDQDFLSTFGSTILRTVWEGRTLLEARLLPVEIDDYAPTLASDEAARRTLRRIAERSVLGARSDRRDGAVRAFVRDVPAETKPAAFAFERHTARVLADTPALAERAFSLAPGETRALDVPGLVDPRLGDGLEIGRDLFEWGRFEDELVGDGVRGAMHWDVRGCDDGIRFAHGDSATSAASGAGFLRLRRTSVSADELSVRPLARTPLVRHRFWDAGGAPLDPGASYTLELRARMHGDAPANVRLDLYAFDDTNPTEDPHSTVLATIERPLPVPADGAWHPISIAIRPEELGEGSRANMVLFYVALGRDRTGTTTLDVDDLAFVEWRPTDRMLDRFGAFDFVRNPGTTTRDVRARFLRE